MKNEEREIVQTLMRSGLTKNEASVYVAILEMGRGTVSQISRKANVNRTTGYDILDSLVAKSLVRISGKEPKQEYVAESPENFIKGAAKRLEEAHEEMRRVEALVPELKSIHKVSGRSQVKFYEGADGLKQVYEDTLTATEPILAYASVEDMHAGLSNYFPAYYKRRTKKGISIQTIMPDTPLSVERASHDAEEARVSALIPAERFAFHPEINIYDNKVMIASWREKLGIIIESAEIADAMKKIFELSWIGAKQSESKHTA